MSFFKFLFGGSRNESNPPTPSEAIQKLREMEDMLTKKEEYLEKRVQQELETAKKNGTKNKRAALQALKRKKRFEKQLLQIGGTLTTIEYQREALENASTNTEVLKILGYGAKALKNAHQMDPDAIHDLMDDIQEQQQVADEISQALSRPVGIGGDLDEDELARELEELEEEALNEKLVSVGPITTELPNPPTAEPKDARAKRDEEEEKFMKELAAWAL